MPIFGSKVGRVARHLVNQQLIVKLNFIFISDANAETKVLLIKFHHFEAANLFSFQLASESKNCSAGVFREIVPAVFFPNLVFGGSDAIPMLSVRLFRSKPNSDASFSETFDRKTSFFSFMLQKIRFFRSETRSFVSRRRNSQKSVSPKMAFPKNLGVLFQQDCLFR